jgi:site-specific DNA recombinase
VFLNRPLVQSLEDDLLLQVQGIVAECERAKIMERSRCGKKHAAQSGSLDVMSGAPFGYLYVSGREASGRFEPVADQARIVQHIPNTRYYAIRRYAKRHHEVGEFR